MGENIVVRKSEDFAVRIVNLYKVMTVHRNEQVLAKQLLRSGTSIGANIAEAQEAQSCADFLSKLYISLKESRETQYWLKLLYRTSFLSSEEYDSIYADVKELRALLTAIIMTKKSNLAK